MIEQDGEKRISAQPEKNGDVFFYSGAGRGEALEQLWDGIVRDIPILLLIGAKGSGKSTLCRKFMEGVPVDCLAVYFAETVESFEEIVTTVAENLGLEVNSSGTGRYIESLVEQIGAHLLSRPLRLVLVFDEAENLYLATLERVRRMLDRVRQSSAPLHILFAGRRTFLENCEQLSICDFDVTEDCRVQLDPLEDYETAELVHQFRRDADDGSAMTEMTNEDITALFEAAQGNLGKTLELLAKQDTLPVEDSSYQTLLNSMSAETVASEQSEKQPMAIRFADFKPYVPWVAGAAAVIVAAFLLLGRPEKVNNNIPAGQTEVVGVGSSEKNSLQNQEVVATPEPDQPAVPPPAAKKSLTAQPSPALSTNVAKPEQNNPPASQREEAEKAPTFATAPPIPPKKIEEKGEAPVITAAKDQPKVVAELPAKEAKRQEQAAPEPRTEKKTSASRIVIKEPIEEPPEVKTITAKSAKIITLTPKPDLKIRPDDEAEPETEKPSPNAAREVVANNTGLTAKQLLMKRMQAGSPWVVGVKDDKFTVQVMVLTSKNAEENIEEMLEQKRYRQEAGNFYVFRKGGNPPQLFVFYGEYDTEAEAKRAHDSLPPFLRENSSPYVISVKEAIAKIL